MTQRTFDLGDILSITTGRLVAPRRIEAIYDILNFMTDDNLFTHQLGRGMEICGPALFKQHPDLLTVSIPDEGFTPESVGPWLVAQKRIHGESLPVAPLASSWTTIDPMLELETMVGKDRVIAVEVSNG